MTVASLSELDHDTFASRIRHLSGLPRSPIKYSKSAAAYCTQNAFKQSNRGRVDQLIQMLDAAGSAIGPLRIEAAALASAAVWAASRTRRAAHQGPSCMAFKHLHP